jgi:hypothetical protein
MYPPVSTRSDFHIPIAGSAANAPVTLSAKTAKIVVTFLIFFAL